MIVMTDNGFEYQELNSSVKTNKSSNTNWGGVNEGFRGAWYGGEGSWVSSYPPL